MRVQSLLGVYFALFCFPVVWGRGLISVILGTEHRTSGLLGRSSTTVLPPQPCVLIATEFKKLSCRGLGKSENEAKG